MIDRVNGRPSAIAHVRGDVDAHDIEYKWYGFDPDAPPPPGDGLNTVEVNDVSLDLADEVISWFTNEINPLEHSSAFVINLFQRGVAFLENLLSNQDNYV